MNEMNRHFPVILHVDGQSELRQFIDLGFMRAPVIGV
jgi:hypothetical protein